MTAAYGHGVTAAILGATLDRALASWWSARGVVLPSESKEVEHGWYTRMLCTHKPGSILWKEWLPR